jgi:FKBP-type peptidyl-prolyl cis-trans isomerase FkpA
MASQHLRKLVLGTALSLLTACSGKPAATAGSVTASPGVAASAAAPAENTLEIGELKPGSGAPIAAGRKAVVEYTGWLYEATAPDKKGKEFDSSRNGGHPFSFVVGAGQVIKGWDQGVLGMKVGARRRLTIPPELAYGDTGSGEVIPPGATLIFDVDLVAIE